MDTIPHLASQMEHVLQIVPNQQAAATGYYQRPPKKLTAAIFVQTLVFGWLADPLASVEDLVGMALALGVEVTGAALQQRFHERAARLLKLVFAASLRMLVAAATPGAILPQFNGIYLRDSTIIALPPALAEVWPGCGGTSPKTCAAGLKVQICLELQSGQLSGELQAAKAHDASLPPPTLPPGSLHVADLGYFSLAFFKSLAQAGCYYLSRLKVGIRIYDQQGEELSVIAALNEQSADELELAVLLGRERIAARLLARRVRSEPELAQRRRKLHEWERKHGCTASAASYAALDWYLYVTNAPATLLSREEGFVVYRSRWQVELVFKRWKSEGGVDEWRTAKAERVMCEVYAKLLAMVVKHWVVLVSCWQQEGRSLSKAGKLVQKAALMLALSSQAVSEMAESLSQLVAMLAHAPTVNKRRHKPSHSQLLKAVSRTNLMPMGRRFIAPIRFPTAPSQ